MEDLFKSLSELTWTGWYRGSKRIDVSSSRETKDGGMVLTLSNGDRLTVNFIHGRYEVSLNGGIIYKNTNLDADWMHSIYEWQLIKRGWKIH